MAPNRTSGMNGSVGPVVGAQTPMVDCCVRLLRHWFGMGREVGLDCWSLTKAWSYRSLIKSVPIFAHLDAFTIIKLAEVMKPEPLFLFRSMSLANAEGLRRIHRVALGSEMVDDASCRYRKVISAPGTLGKSEVGMVRFDVFE